MSTHSRDGENVQARGASFGARHAAPGRVTVRDFSGHIDRPYVAFGWMTVLVALTLQSSFLTPPFGFALFFVKGAAPDGIRMADVYRGIVPFVIIQLIVIVCVAALPTIAT